MLTEKILRQSNYRFYSIDALLTTFSEREPNAAESRSDAVCDREGAADPRFSIDRLWDVLRPAAAIF